jgi:hypothetical protein
VVAEGAGRIWTAPSLTRFWVAAVQEVLCDRGLLWLAVCGGLGLHDSRLSSAIAVMADRFECPSSVAALLSVPLQDSLCIERLCLTPGGRAGTYREVVRLTCADSRRSFPAP